MLVIVDAWEYDVSAPQTAESIAHIKHTHALGHFINIVCDHERQKGNTVVFVNTNHPIMHHVDTKNDMIVSSLQDIKFAMFLRRNPHSMFYIGGFAYESCVLREYFILLNALHNDTARINIALNLTLPFKGYWTIEKNIEHCLWAADGFQKLDLI